MSAQPTDDELDEILCGQWPAFSMQATLVRMWVRQAMRDAIARWGQPPVGSEPLTTAQVSGLLESAGYWSGDTAKADFINGIRYAEAAHGIKTQEAGNAE